MWNSSKMGIREKITLYTKSQNEQTLIKTTQNNVNSNILLSALIIQCYSCLFFIELLLNVCVWQIFTFACSLSFVGTCET